MKSIILSLFLSICISHAVSAGDWGGAFGQIDKVYSYPKKLVIVQGNAYAGEAGCESNRKASLLWSELDAGAAERLYATIVSAYHARAKVKFIYHSGGCGPEGHKHLNGSIVLE